MINIILAVDSNFGIGIDNDIGNEVCNKGLPLPWKLSKDLHYFKETTSKVYDSKYHGSSSGLNILLMGRKTADTFKAPLPGRVNYVLTSQRNYRVEEGFYSSSDLLCILEDVLTKQKTGQWGKLFAIGGKALIGEILKYPNLIETVYLTRIKSDYQCNLTLECLGSFLMENKDTYRLSLVNRDGLDNCKLTGKTVRLEFEEYSRRDNIGTGVGVNEGGETCYLNYLFSLLYSPIRSTRNGLTMSNFGAHLTFNLKEGFPALTTKRLFWKGVVNELLFFLGGCTDNKWLQDRGVHIWDGNTSSSFLESTGLPYSEGDLGPMYGYQFRYFGKEYKGKEVYSVPSPECDQLAEVISLIRNDPFSRRILLTTYNYSQAKQGVLYPCHGLVIQFYVQPDFSIDCQMYQRSADWFLGVPFNIASYALLVCILVNHLNYLEGDRKFSPGRLLMTFGDYHLYASHTSAALTQLGRFPKKYPTLNIIEPIVSIEPNYLLGLTPDNFQLVDYTPYPSIRAEMVA